MVESHWRACLASNTLNSFLPAQDRSWGLERSSQHPWTSSRPPHSWDGWGRQDDLGQEGEHDVFGLLTLPGHCSINDTVVPVLLLGVPSCLPGQREAEGPPTGWILMWRVLRDTPPHITQDFVSPQPAAGELWLGASAQERRVPGLEFQRVLRRAKVWEWVQDAPPWVALSQSDTSPPHPEEDPMPLCQDDQAGHGGR